MTKQALIEAAVAAVEQEIDNQQKVVRNPFDFNHLPWSKKGSAGKALGWFIEIAAASPHATRRQLVHKLSERIVIEREAHPRYFTPRHLNGVRDLIAVSLDVDGKRGPLA